MNRALNKTSSNYLDSSFYFYYNLIKLLDLLKELGVSYTHFVNSIDMRKFINYVTSNIVRICTTLEPYKILDELFESIRYTQPTSNQR